MKPSKLIPIRDAAKALSIGSYRPSLWLIRRLKQLRDETGVDLLIPTGRSMKSPRYRVSLSALKTNLPELFDFTPDTIEGDAMAEAVAGIARLVRSIDDRLDQQDERLSAIQCAVARRPRSS